MSVRTASFEATYTTGIATAPASKSDDDTFKVTVEKTSGTDAKRAVYTWDFNIIESTYSSIVTEIGSATVIGLQVSFNHNLSSDGGGLSIVKYGGGDPKVETASAISDAITATELGAASITTSEKRSVTIDLDDASNMFYETEVAIGSGNNVTVIIVRDTDFDTSVGSFEVSGRTLVTGAEWRTVSGGEISDPPLLIVKYETSAESHPVLNMKYTTLDPTTNQNSPSGSIGKYIALNDVFPSSPIGDSISSVQITVPIKSGSSLPSAIGLASVGPEILKYSLIDSTNNQLTSVTRGIAPKASFPAGFDAFRVPENVYYLDTDLLFDTRPSGSLVQYRCVAISNTDTGDDFNIKNACIGVLQNSGDNVQIHIGVEFPKFDARTGTAASGTTTSRLIDTSIVDDDGFFNGALIKFLSPTEYAIVTSYVSPGDFILNKTVTTLITGRSFVIIPGVSQRILNDNTAPTSNAGRFTGFSEDGTGIEISLTEHGTTMQENDLFYVWIRRTLLPNVKSTDDTGAVLIFRFRDV